MLIDGILFVFKNFLIFLLSPLNVINVSVDWIASFENIKVFFSLVAYILPWNNLKSLFIIVFAVISFRITITIVRTIRSLF